MDQLDTVVIGSGAGGLTTAVALANNGQRVLVLEQHHRVGGWCHSFQRKGYHFSPGVHYLGELGEGEVYGDIFQGLGVSEGMEFLELNPDGYDHLIVGEERFDIPAGRERFRERILERFPGETRGINRFFKRMGRVADEFDKAGDYMDGWKKLLLPFVIPRLIAYGNRYLAPFANKALGGDPLLKAFLTARGGIYGLPPSQATQMMHATTLYGHYKNGAYYPRGGAQMLPEAFVRQLQRKGGELRLSAPVARILIEKGRACGVVLEDGEEIRARHVVSNADPEVTFRRLVGEDRLPARLARRVGRTRYSGTCLSLFLATDLDLPGMGFDSGNYWYYETSDLEGIHARSREALPEPFEQLFLSVTTLKDPGLRSDNRHTVEVFTVVPHSPFAKWADQPQGKRDPEYQQLKERLTGQLLALSDRIIPGLSQNLVYQDLGTPLTNDYFCRSHLGSMYGTEKTRDQSGGKSYPVKTKIPGLYMTGASTFMHGVMGATVAGMFTAAAILNRTLDDIMVEESKPHKIVGN